MRRDGVVEVFAVAAGAVAARRTAATSASYSYVDDDVNLLGGRFAGDFMGCSVSSPLRLLMDVGGWASGSLVAVSTARLSAALSGWRSTLVVALGVTLAVALRAALLRTGSAHTGARRPRRR